MALPSPDRKTGWNIGYWLLAIAALMWFQSAWQTARTVEAVPYSQFQKALAEGKVAEVVVGETTITGKLKAPEGNKTVIVANRVEPELAKDLGQYGVTYTQIGRAHV